MPPFLRSLLFLAVLAVPAAAETRRIDQFGVWEVFGGTAEDGLPVCGVSTVWPDGRYLAMKYYSGQQHFTLQAVGRGWKVANGSRLPVVLRFDQLSPWNGNATSSVRPNLPGAVLELTVPFARLDQFLREFRLAYAGQLSFPSGLDQTWALELTGSNAASQTMDVCIKRMAITGGAPAPAPVPQPRSGGSKF